MGIISNNLQLIISLLWGLVIFLLIISLGKTTTDSSVRSQVNQRKLSRQPQKRPLARLLGLSLESLGLIIEKLPLGEQRAKAAQLLREAGSPGNLSPDEFIASSILGSFCLGLVGYFFDLNLALTPICTIGLALLGAYYPKLWISGKIAQRKQHIFRDLPDLLDTLRIAVSAGLDFTSALRVVVDTASSGPLLSEFDKVERDVALGETRSNALQAMATRIGMSEINAFVLAVRQADDLGAPIGPVLCIQSEVARQRRWQLAEVQVGKLPMKLLGPLVICIFPASFIILFTPLIIDYLRTGI